MRNSPQGLRPGQLSPPSRLSPNRYSPDQLSPTSNSNRLLDLNRRKSMSAAMYRTGSPISDMNKRNSRAGGFSRRRSTFNNIIAQGQGGSPSGFGLKYATAHMPNSARSHRGYQYRLTQEKKAREEEMGRDPDQVQ